MKTCNASYSVHFKELPRTTGNKLLINDRDCTLVVAVQLSIRAAGTVRMNAAAAVQKPHDLGHENTGATITARNSLRPDQAPLPAACEMGASVGASVGVAFDEPFPARMSA